MTASEGRVPHYHRIKLALLEEIRRGAYRPDRPFITEREICSRFGVSRPTAVRTLTELVHDGVLVRRQGVGTFVAQPRAQAPARSPDRPGEAGDPRLIGCIFTTFASMHVTSVIQGVEHACSLADYHVLLLDSQWSPETEARNLQRAIQAGVRGLIVYPVEGSANVSQFEALTRAGVPFVLVDRYFLGLACDVVVPNNVMVGYQLTGHLIQLGHRHIATVWAEATTTAAHDRLTGYRMALQEHGIAIEPALAALYDYDDLPEQDRRARVAAWLHAPCPPTAYLAVNSGTLAMVARDLLACGVRIPGEVALASMDSSSVDPILSTATASAVLPSYDMGQEAMRLLRERLEGSVERPSQHIVLPTGIRTAALNDVHPGLAPDASATMESVERSA